ncbi:MAG TPA: hypothetical protein VMX54_20975 [Vicinamibacteria bacterium]|nr:hypothetical protein [Vicinamibacteria bacterium]
MQASSIPAAAGVAPRAAGPLRPAVRLLLWDYARGSLAYDLVLLLVVLVVLLVPGAFWGDPLWVR